MNAIFYTFMIKQSFHADTLMHFKPFLMYPCYADVLLSMWMLFAQNEGFTPWANKMSLECAFPGCVYGVDGRCMYPRRMDFILPIIMEKVIVNFKIAPSCQSVCACGCNTQTIRKLCTYLKRVHWLISTKSCSDIFPVNKWCMACVVVSTE